MSITPDRPKMSSGLMEGMEVIPSINVDELVNEAMKISQSKNASGAIDSLLNAEKQTRMGGEFDDNSKIISTIVQICFDNREWQLLNDNIVNLSKKRAIIKQSIVKMFQKCLEFVEQVPDRESKEILLNSVRTNTEGKVYVEVERARATRALATFKESDGSFKEAFELLQEVAVETFSSMERKEKYDFILEQMRLALITDQFNQAQIISRKINPKIFNNDAEESLKALKVKYAELMIKLNLHFKKFLECAKCCRSIVNSSNVDNNRVFTEMVIFLLLSPFSKEQHEMINQILTEKKIKSFPIFADLIKIFLKKELIRWVTVETIVSTNSLFQSEIFSKADWISHLQKRVVEHNIRVIAELYSKITMKRMSELLDMSEESTEDTLTELIGSGIVSAKIDRFEGKVIFTNNNLEHSDEHVLLNQWSSQVDSLLTLLVKTNHMISKEEMAQSLFENDSNMFNTSSSFFNSLASSSKTNKNILMVG